MKRLILPSLCCSALLVPPINSPAAEATLAVVDDTCLVQDAGANDNNFGGRVELLTSNNNTAGSARRFGLLRFDFSGLAGQYASIDAMTLKLRLRSGGSRAVPTTGQILDIFRIADENAGWVEGTGQASAANDGVTAVDCVSYRFKKDNADAAQQIAWAGSAGLNTAGTDYFASALGSTATFNTTSGYAPGSVISIPLTATGFTLTEMVNAWISQGGTANAGFLIRGRNNSINQIFFDAIETTDAGAQPAQLVITYTPGTVDPYVLWAQANGLTGPNADPTSDGDMDDAINLLEFGLDGNPKSGLNDGKLRHQLASIEGQTAFTFTCPVRNGAAFAGTSSLTASQDGVQYEVRAGTDLNTWALDVDEVTPALSAGLPALSIGWSYRTFRVVGPASAYGRVFFQVAVSQNLAQ